MSSTPKMLNCAVCQKAFLRKSELSRHELIHAPNLEELKIKCPYEGCKFSCLQKSGLKTHITSVHTKEKPHRCRVPECNDAFSDPATRTRHERNAHGISGRGKSRARNKSPKRRRANGRPGEIHEWVDCSSSIAEASGHLAHASKATRRSASPDGGGSFHSFPSSNDPVARRGDAMDASSETRDRSTIAYQSDHSDAYGRSASPDGNGRSHSFPSSHGPQTPHNDDVMEAVSETRDRSTMDEVPGNLTHEFTTAERSDLHEDIDHSHIPPRSYGFKTRRNGAVDSILEPKDHLSSMLHGSNEYSAWFDDTRRPESPPLSLAASSRAGTPQLRLGTAQSVFGINYTLPEPSRHRARSLYDHIPTLRSTFDETPHHQLNPSRPTQARRRSFSLSDADHAHGSREQDQSCTSSPVIMLRSPDGSVSPLSSHSSMSDEFENICDSSPPPEDWVSGPSYLSDVSQSVRDQSHQVSSPIVTQYDYLCVQHIRSVMCSLSLTPMKFRPEDAPLWRSVYNDVRRLTLESHDDVTQDEILEQTAIRSLATYVEE